MRKLRALRATRSRSPGRCICMRRLLYQYRYTTLEHRITATPRPTHKFGCILQVPHEDSHLWLCAPPALLPSHPALCLTQRKAHTATRSPMWRTQQLSRVPSPDNARSAHNTCTHGTSHRSAWRTSGTACPFVLERLSNTPARPQEASPHTPDLSRGRPCECNRSGDVRLGYPRSLAALRLWHGTLLGVPSTLLISGAAVPFVRERLSNTPARLTWPDEAIVLRSLARTM